MISSKLNKSQTYFSLNTQVYQFEGKYPQHMVPEPWIIYNEIYGIKRGLFFM